MKSVERWERFAQLDADYYVHTDVVVGANPHGSLFEHGEELADRILEHVGPHLPGDGLAVELGCGVGRLAIPLSRRFARLLAVDVAPTMLARLRENAEGRGAGGIETMLPDAPWDRPGSADLIYTHQVFQHVEREDVIRDYVRRAAPALVPGAVLNLHVDTRPRSQPNAVRRAEPDPLLPRAWRRGIRRIRRPQALYHGLLARHGLEIVQESGPGTAWHEIVARRPGG